MALKLVNARTVDQWVEVILSKWQDSVTGIMETGLALHNAREELGSAAFWKMVRDDLNFATGTATKLIAIGTDPKLMEVYSSSQGKKLPAAWTILYLLARLTDEQFQHGIDSGIIHAGMERKDVAQLKPPKPKPLPPPALTGQALIQRRTQECRGRIAQTLRECANHREQSDFLALMRLQLDDLENRLQGAA